ncbi:MAG: trigger factor [Candidatus Scalindua sediminis]|nr:trigger factor [Candidatus Scalindua sediminis]
MKVEIEEIGPCKKLLKVEIPKEKIDDEWQEQLKELCKMADLPGFRKGKAPRSLVEKKFGERLMEDVKQKLVSSTYEEAVEKNKLSPVGEPEISDVNMELGKPLNFEVTMEVLPTFEIGEYKGLQLKKESVSVTDKDIKAALKTISGQKTQLTIVKDGKVEDDDYIICDCKVKVGRKIVFEDEDLEVMVSGSTVADINVPDLKSNLLGTKSGGKCSIDVELGDNFSVEQYRNKSAKLEISVKEIKRPVSPEIDDEMAKQMGYDSLAELSEFVSKKLEAEKKRMVDNDMREQIYKNLLEMANFDLPKDVIESQINKRLHRHQIELLNRGTPLEEIEKDMGNLKNASEESVIKDFKLSLILERIAEKEKIFVTEAEVNQRINTLANMYGTEPSKMRNQLEKIGNIPNLRYQMKESKTVDFLIKEAVTKEPNQKKK